MEVFDFDEVPVHEPFYMFRDSNYVYFVNEFNHEYMLEATGMRRLALAHLVISLEDNSIQKSRLF